MSAIGGLQVEVLVVDNESIEHELNPLQQAFPTVQWIINSQNHGFAKANNQALVNSRGELVLFLNPDTLVSQDAFTKCINHFSNNPLTGAIGVQMVNLKGAFLPESKRSFPSLWNSFCQLSVLASIFPTSAFWNGYALGSLDKNEVHSVAVLAGAFMMVRTKLVKELNGFDEQFFMYGEDIDLSKRLLDTGFQNIYLGSAIIRHVKGASKQPTKTYLYHFYYSMELFVQKYKRYYGGDMGVYLLKYSIRLAALLASYKRGF